MVKEKLQSHTGNITSKHGSHAPTRKDLLKCVAEICYDSDGKLVLDLSKRKCPPELKKRIVDHYSKGGTVDLKIGKMDVD